MVSTSHTLRQDATPSELRRSVVKGDYVIASLLVVVGSLIFLAASPAVEHWFLLPVFLCGVLTAVDLVRWARGRLDAFDPQTVIGLLGFYGFFVAPLLHVTWDRFGAGYDFVLW